MSALYDNWQGGYEVEKLSLKSIRFMIRKIRSHEINADDISQEEFGYFQFFLYHSTIIQGDFKDKFGKAKCGATTFDFLKAIKNHSNLFRLEETIDNMFSRFGVKLICYKFRNEPETLHGEIIPDGSDITLVD